MTGVPADLCCGLAGASFLLGYVEAFDIVFLVSSGHLVAAQMSVGGYASARPQGDVPHALGGTHG